MAEIIENGASRQISKTESLARVMQWQERNASIIRWINEHGVATNQHGWFENYPGSHTNLANRPELEAIAARLMDGAEVVRFEVRSGSRYFFCECDAQSYPKMYQLEPDESRGSHPYEMWKCNETEFNETFIAEKARELMT